MDEALRELERAVFAAPSDGAARIALARGLARAGRRADAIEAFHKARVLGAALDDVRVGLRGLGAPVSPWGHAGLGDSRNSRWSPLTGPRRGEVVAASPPGYIPGFVVIDERGDLLSDEDHVRRLVMRDGVTLAEKGRRAANASPGFAVAAGDVVLREGPRVGVAELEAISPDGATRTLVRRLANDDFLYLPHISPRGDVVVLARSGAVTVLSPELEARASFSAGGRSASAAFDGERIAVLVAEPGPEAMLRVFDLAGAVLFERVLQANRNRFPACIDEQGLIHVVDGGGASQRLVAIGRDGRDEWTVSVRSADMASVAAGEDACYVSCERTLRRIEGGRVAWTFTAEDSVWNSVVDRHGVVYFMLGDKGLVAVGPDGAVVFERRDGTYRPLAIDAHERLIAVRTKPLQEAELVAIE